MDTSIRIPASSAPAAAPPDTRPLRLERRGEVASVVGAGRPAVLRVTEGRAWVTREGDAADHVLRPGDALPLPAHGRTVLQALRAPCCAFVVEGPAV